MPGAFAQLLTAADTGIFAASQLQAERAAYMADFGPDMGNALFEQEYECSFEAAILGAYYGRELSQARSDGRICSVEYDSAVPVHTAWDLGFSDDVAIWFYQLVSGEIHVIDYEAHHTQNVEFYSTLLKKKGYDYVKRGGKPLLYLPHDARAKTLAAQGKSVEQQFVDQGYSVAIVPNLSLQDGIQASRKTFPRCWFDEDKCAAGLDALSQYQREWDDDKKCFRDHPRHDWTSHPADAFRYLSVMWQEDAGKKEPERAKYPEHQTFNDMLNAIRRSRREEIYG
jgi:hypothetical protein